MNDRSTPGWLNTTSLVLAGLSLVLVVANVAMLWTNQNLQTDVTGRAQYINQSNRLGQLNTALVNLLATSAVENKDDKLTELLTAQGISYRLAPNTGQPGATAPTPKAPPTR